MAQDFPTIGGVNQSIAAAFNSTELKVESVRSCSYGATAPLNPVTSQLWDDGTDLRIWRSPDWVLIAPSIQGTTIGATSSVDGVAVFVAKTSGLVAGLRLLPVVTMGVHASNYYSAQVDNVTATVDLFASAPGTDSTAWTSGTPVDLTPDQNQAVSADDILRVTISATGAPADIDAIGVQLTITHT